MGLFSFRLLGLPVTLLLLQSEFLDGPLAHFLWAEKQIGGRMAGQNTQLQALLEPTVTAMGYELWGVEYHASGKHRQLRVFIDREQGIDVDDCARVSHQISGVLDVEDPISGNYRLEVSSPGMDRPLYTQAQYRMYLGALLRVKLKYPFEGRRKYEGRLVELENDEVSIAVGEDVYILPWEQIDRANVVPEFE